MLMKLMPNFKGFDFFPHDLSLPFMRYKDLAVGLSIVAMIASLALVHDARAQLRRRLQGRIAGRIAGGERHG